MRGISVRSDDKKAIEKATALLKRKLRKGDIILTGPIPKNFIFKYFNFVSMISRKILRGITHSCIYLGEGDVFEINYKIMKSGGAIEKMTLKKLIKNKLEHFGGVIIYIVQPKQYTNKHRNLVKLEAVNNFLKKSKQRTFSYLESFKTGFKFLFDRKDFYKEDNLNYGGKWHCSNIVAFILKKSKVPIGKRAYHTFVPCTFVFSKHFRVKEKIILK